MQTIKTQIFIMLLKFFISYFFHKTYAKNKPKGMNPTALISIGYNYIIKYISRSFSNNILFLKGF